LSVSQEELPVPLDEAECERLLRVAERKLRSAETRRTTLMQLARFLGASSRVWTRDRRMQLSELLARYDAEGVLCALRVVAETPKVEVEDEALRVLRAIVRSRQAIAGPLAAAVRGSAVEPPELGALAAVPAVRALLTLALAVAAPTPRQLEAIGAALEDRSAEVREAAARAMATLSNEGALDMLRKRAQIERDELVRQSIADAVEELQSR
jgi:hypothetical protein